MAVSVRRIYLPDPEYRHGRPRVERGRRLVAMDRLVVFVFAGSGGGKPYQRVCQVYHKRVDTAHIDRRFSFAGVGGRGRACRMLFRTCRCGSALFHGYRQAKTEYDADAYADNYLNNIVGVGADHMGTAGRRVGADRDGGVCGRASRRRDFGAWKRLYPGDKTALSHKIIRVPEIFFYFFKFRAKVPGAKADTC